jgi:hypothetical protein
MKGCYVYVCDEPLRKYLQNSLTHIAAAKESI